jgi:S1-C subfamily serine protease
MKKLAPLFALMAASFLFAAHVSTASAQDTQPAATSSSVTQLPQQPGSVQVSQDTTLFTNKDVIEMVKAGLGPTIIIAKIKASQTKFDTSPSALQELKTAGATDEVILAVIEAAAIKHPASSETTPAGKRGRMTDELTSRYKELQTSIVTVWSEVGHGTGFLFDGRGLVMTNQHVIGPSSYAAVQFDERRKVEARILAVDPAKDVAVLWID